MPVAAITHNIQEESSHDTFWLILLGCLALGGTKGRFIAGLSPFDFLLVFLFIKSLKRLSVHRFTLYFGAIAIYGVIVALLNKFLIGHSYEFFITELRFYLYIPMLYQVVYALDFNPKRINSYLTVLILIYLVMYFFF
jgi:hypothetical protein